MNKSPRQKVVFLVDALAQAGVLDRAAAEEAIREGRVTVDGRRARQPLTALKPAQKVAVDNRLVTLGAPATRVLLFHKPEGCVTSTVDKEGMPTVFDLLRRVLPDALTNFGWHAVGRLDRNTTGLLLFTNDARVVAHVTDPKNHLPRQYLAEVGSDVTPDKLRQLRDGVALPDGEARAVEAKQRGAREVELVIDEGRFHQVKRMLAAVGLPVRTLRRESVGALKLDVPPGQFRELTAQEVKTALGWEAGG